MGGKSMANSENAHSRPPAQMAASATSRAVPRTRDETDYLARTPESAGNLSDSIAQIERGQVVVVDTEDLGIHM